ncbi:hypothetical protein PAUR_b0469 [Pseudoalteromonas aurantia 208]|uniref:Uncharacterized protein n=1 Tax=Pseudoalteromonas aurantia 208 TaxID=1314867 RepID=A0ABR9EHI6_9GAMM|nr:hypothetical protein [Pseudoalteromonas aurantia 208]
MSPNLAFHLRVLLNSISLINGETLNNLKTYIFWDTVKY